jgi:diguanylate cyclase (GGDEF)-like protein
MSTPPRILIVDDNETNLDILEELLGDDYELSRATSGEECLEVADKCLPDLVLLDIMMPGIDGYETCRRLRATRNLEHTKVIMLSAKTRLDERLAGYEAGGDDYLPKPFDSDELLSKVRVFLRLKTAEESTQELTLSNERLEAEVIRRQRAEERLRHDALHDVLTNLPNRALLSDRIESCLHRTRREATRKFGVLFLDLDDFKVVNDAFGHRVGDRFLIEIGQRLQSSIRATDCATRLSNGSLSRLGGDEFVILLEGIRTLEDAEYIADRVRTSLARPISVGGRDIRPTASIGIAIGPASYEDADEILRDADTALYHAKNLGKNRVSIFDAEMRDRVVARMQLESELSKALDRDQLYLQYQPIVDLSSEDVVGLEALVRWNHPEHGVIPPGEFIPLAEETGLIIPLGGWVLATACRQIARWREAFPERSNLSISVNLSGKQFSSPNLAEEVRQVLLEASLAPAHLNLELTETVLMRDSRTETDNLRDLAAQDIGLHMDDFGTGYSSLSYLSKLPITTVKLDRSFVQNMVHDKGDETTIKAIMEMAHSRGLKVIAEGVESPEQAALLRLLGCDQAQGFLYARPLDADVVERMLSVGATRGLTA